MEHDSPNPSAELTVETDETIELLALERRFDLIRQLIDYNQAIVDKRIKSGLLPYQVPAFTDTVDFFRTYAQQLTSADQLTLSGYLDLPTSFGKSVMMAKLAEGFGIGKTPEGRARKRKALILVPSQQSVEQTIGRVDEDGNGGGFAKHAPDITTGAYYQFDRNLDADAVVMTYASFLLFVKRIASGQVVDPDFDLIMCDEAQHTLGAEMSAALETYREGKIAIGLTATPEYDDERTIEHLFTERIHKSELLPLVESGVLNGVQLIGLATGRMVNTSGKGEFTEAELRPLIFDGDRNTVITEMAKQLIAEGRRGVINAVRGQKAKHAVLLAEMLNGQEISDENGDTITIRAECISSFIDSAERRRILREYHEGKIHVLTQVQALNENWDENDVGFIINAAPTSSKVVAYQRIGRGMRPNGDWPITVIVELMDEIVGRKNVVTAWNVFGEDEYEQGKVFTTPERRARAAREKHTSQKRNMGNTAMAAQNVTPPSNADDPTDWAGEPVDVTQAGSQSKATPKPAYGSAPPEPSSRRLTFDLDKLEGVLRQSTQDFTLRVARELTIKPQEVIGPPKPGWIELVSLLGIAQQKEMGIFALRSALINEGGFACELAETPHGDRYFLEPGARQFALDYEPLPWAPSTHKSAAELSRQLGTPREIMDAIIKELKAQPAPKIKGESMRSPLIKRKLTYYNPSEIALIEAHVNEIKAEMPQDGEDVVFLSELVAETGMVRGPIQFFLVRHHGIKGEERRSAVTNQLGMAYTKAEADIARFHFSHQEVPKRAKRLEHLEQATGLTEAAIRQRVTARKLEHIIKKGRVADARGDYHYILFCAEQDFERAVDALTRDGTEHIEPPIVVATPATATPPTKPPSAIVTAPPPPPKLPPPPPDKKAPPKKKVESSPTLDGIKYIDFLREVRCNPAAARYLLRQLPFAAGAMRQGSDGELYIEQQAAAMLRGRCAHIGPPPRTSRSDRYFAERFQRPLSEIHAVVTSIMPEPSQVGLFRADDGSNIITFHYTNKLAAQIEHIMRQNYGTPN